MNLAFKGKSMLTDDSGIAMPLVLMVMLILILFGTAAYTASQSSLKQATRLDPTLQCKYLARSAVDATKENWTAQWLNNPDTVSTNETFYTRYDETSSEFESVNNASEYDDDYVIKTVQIYDSDTGICAITSSVNIGSHSATVSARSEKLIETDVTADEMTDPWYGEKEYGLTVPILGYISWERWTILPGSDEETVTDKDGRQYHATYHTTEGIVNIGTDEDNSEVLYANGTMWDDVYIDSPSDFFDNIYAIGDWLAKTNADNLLEQLLPTNSPVIQYNVTGLQAKRIAFDCPVNLYYNTSFPFSALLKSIPNPHSLILSAETIVFNNSLTIGDSAYGNLTLRLPPGSGMPGTIVYKRVAEANTARSTADKVDLDTIDQEAKFGLVKFSSVNVEGSSDSRNAPSLISNKAFFFRVMDEKALNIGTEPNTFSILADLLEITNAENDCRFQTLLDEGYLIPATSDDVAEFSDILFIYE